MNHRPSINRPSQSIKFRATSISRLCQFHQLEAAQAVPTTFRRRLPRHHTKTTRGRTTVKVKIKHMDEILTWICGFARYPALLCWCRVSGLPAPSEFLQASSFFLPADGLTPKTESKESKKEKTEKRKHTKKLWILTSHNIPVEPDRPVPSFWHAILIFPKGRGWYEISREWMIWRKWLHTARFHEKTCKNNSASFRDLDPVNLSKFYVPFLHIILTGEFWRYSNEMSAARSKAPTFFSVGHHILVVRGFEGFGAGEGTKTLPRGPDRIPGWHPRPNDLPLHKSRAKGNEGKCIEPNWDTGSCAVVATSLLSSALTIRHGKKAHHDLPCFRSRPYRTVCDFARSLAYFDQWHLHSPQKKRAYSHPEAVRDILQYSTLN